MGRLKMKNDKDLGKSIGKGTIPKNRMDWVIQKLGESFRSPFHALRQYIDNAKDSIDLKNKFSKDTSNLIIIEANKKEKSIRIVDGGPGISPETPIYETPSGGIILDESGKKKPYINSFKNMKDNIGNSVKQFMQSQTGENATGMLAFIKLNCKNIKFISRVNGVVNTYTITKDNTFFINEGGDKFEDADGVEILLEGIDKRLFDNHFNPKKLEMDLRKTYHEDLLSGNIKINLFYDVTKKPHTKGRKKNEPFIQIKPMEITGDPLDIDQIKTKSGNLIHINLKLKKHPSDDAFVTINCRGTGGVPATEVFYSSSLWANKYTWGFIDVDFLNFSGNDKSNFQSDEHLKEFIEAIEEKVEPKLIEHIAKIKSIKEQEKREKMIQFLETALSRTLRNLDINLEGMVNKTKKCPKCEKIVPYNQQTCPECEFEWPKSMKNCKFCLKEIPSTSSICPECGKELIEKISCPFCHLKIPKLSYTCPECGKKLREPPKKPRGKSPQILPWDGKEYGPRSFSDEDENGVIKVIRYNTDHEDYTKALEAGFEELYVSVLIGKEIAKHQFGKEKPDYSDDMIGILLGMFKSLMEVGSIKYSEEIE